MRLLLLNPPHPSIGSRIPNEHLPPLGLLAIGGPLLDAGHTVTLLDADFGPMPPEEIVRRTAQFAPDAILLGHSGSTSAHPIICRLTRMLRRALPQCWIIYGGVFPTFHWQQILEAEPQIDIIVRGEGERTAVHLIQALAVEADLATVPGVAFRRNGCRSQENAWKGSLQKPVKSTLPSNNIDDLDQNRVGWELIDHSRYTYWGGKRAVVVQFSRGCPHRCNYCGQRVFWQKWRHRHPVRFASELAELNRRNGVEVINFADENPTASRSAWREFLEALIAENVPLLLVGSTRASDIVRDADTLHLYKKAGVVRLLMGIESTQEGTLGRIKKDSSTALDREAIRLLRQHGIISMAAFVTGFSQETDADYWRLLRQLKAYDPDQIQALYATPHAWTDFAHEERHRTVIQTDLGRWDYKHQVLASPVPSWRVLVWMKIIEAVMQLRVRSLRRLVAHPDPGFRAAMRWYYGIGRRVWPYELWNWCFQDRRTLQGPILADFWANGATEDLHVEPEARELGTTHG